MKQFLYISFLLVSILSFGQETNTNTKTIRGFVFGNNLPHNLAEIQIKGTDRKTITDEDGKFEIEALENQILIVSALGYDSKEITITGKNCYRIDIFDTDDYPLFFSSEKQHKIYLKNKRKIERNVKRKIKKGFYDCLD